MKRKHHAEKHRDKKYLMGKDQLNPQEKIASLKALFEGSKDVIRKPPVEPLKREETSPEKLSQAINPPFVAKLMTSATTTTDTTPPMATLLEDKKAHQNPIEKLETKCKKISEHVNHFLKHLF